MQFTIENAKSAGTSVSGLTPTEFLTQYARLWQAPQPQRFADFYHRQGRMLNPGMHRPLCKAEIPGYYAFLLSTIPDLCCAGFDFALRAQPVLPAPVPQAQVSLSKGSA